MSDHTVFCDFECAGFGATPGKSKSENEFVEIP